MKLLIEKFAGDEEVYATTLTDKQWETYRDNQHTSFRPPGNQLDASYLNGDNNCCLSRLDCGHIVFDIKEQKKKKKKRKKKCSLMVRGRHITQFPGPCEPPKGTPPKFYSSLTDHGSHVTIRVDDENHPEFWLEVIIKKEPDEKK